MNRVRLIVMALLCLPASGAFKVRVTVPYAVRLMDASNDDVVVGSDQTASGSIFEYHVLLEKSECSYLELDVEGKDPRATATVTGNVRTPMATLTTASRHAITWMRLKVVLNASKSQRETPPRSS